LPNELFVELPPDDATGGSAGGDQENELAARVQSSILPTEVELEELGVSAGMVPTEIVAGDYFDVVSTKDGCWLAIGNIEGQGLTAGVIMLMVQSAVQSLVRLAPQASPRDLLCALNAALYENIRERMKGDEHVTFCLARYSADGALTYAGAHANILICRADGKESGSIPPGGPRLGAVRDIRGMTSETPLHLAPGDVMVFFTNGVIATRNERGEEFGVERMREKLVETRALTPHEIRIALMNALLEWNPRPDDDITLVVVGATAAASDAR
jgi:serine phosphatase RsbU (regulator of sigma subunit)